MGMISTVKRAAALVRLAKMAMAVLEIGATIADHIDEAVDGAKAGWRGETLPTDEECAESGTTPPTSTKRTAARYAQAAQTLVAFIFKFFNAEDEHTEPVKEVSPTAESEPEPEEEPEQMSIFQLIPGGAEA